MQTPIQIGRIVLVLVVAAAFPRPVGAQNDDGTPVSEDEVRIVAATAALRWSGTGRRLGTLSKGKTVARLTLRSGWVRVRVRGWMWAASLAEAADGYRVRPARENLRVRPNGPIEGTLVQGVVVTRIGGTNRWYEIELIGWVEAEALEERESADGALNAMDRRPSAQAVADLAAPAGRLTEETGLRVRPGGDPVATLPAGTVVRPAETRGSWTRVVIEAWVPSGSVAGGDSDVLDPAVVAAAAPGAYAGRPVVWTLEHVALQEADEWRPDFNTGEHYDLARVPGSDAYVYLVIEPALVPVFEVIPAFRTIRVEGTIRTGRSSLTRNPILEVTRLLP